jgi:1-acyl-sn-glycerol-3-phosphate acyltransferase
MRISGYFIAARALIFIPLLTAIGAILGIFVGYFDRGGRYFHLYFLKPWSCIVLWLAAVRVTVHGQNNIDPGKKSCIVVFNHQSHLDIPLIIYSVPLQLRFIGKIELSRIPFFGAAASRTGHFFVNRQNHEEALASIRKAGDFVRAEGFSLVFAPEGTRSSNGNLLPFKKGAFVTAIETGLPILPVTITGSAQRLPKGSLRARRGPVEVMIHPLVDITGLTYEDRDDLMENVRKMMEKPLKKV